MVFKSLILITLANIREIRQKTRENYQYILKKTKEKIARLKNICSNYNIMEDLREYMKEIASLMNL